MELFNTLPQERLQGIEDFLTFIPIYDSKRREKAYRGLLNRNKKLIQGKVCCEAGAGRGIFAQQMVDMGAEKVYAVERSEAMLKLLRPAGEQIANLEIVDGYIEDFEPEEQIDLLLHEFYGPLVLDETIFALRDLSIKPGTVMPDGGRLWAMPMTLEQVLEKTPYYEASWQKVLDGVLVSDLFSKLAFEPTWKVFEWDISQSKEEFIFEVPEACEFLAFCGEITHQGKSVLKMWWTHNWPIIFTPATGTRCSFFFEYIDGFTDVYFEWLKS